MLVDIVTILQYKRLGTPGYVLLEAGLIEIEMGDGDSSDSHTLLATDALRHLFTDLPPDAVADVLAALQDWVVAYAFDQSGFLDGSSLNLDAVNRLRTLGVRDTGLGQLRNLIVKAATEAGRCLEQSRKARR